MEIKIEQGKIYIVDKDGMTIGNIEKPVTMEIWDGEQNAEINNISVSYDEIKKEKEIYYAKSYISLSEYGEMELLDTYQECLEGLELKRKLKINKCVKKGVGIRLSFKMELFPLQNPNFSEMNFFAPPAIFDKNDLDEDGYEDYFHTQKVIFRDDRFNYPMFMGYFEKEGKAIRLSRHPLPKFDSIPIRKEIEGEKAALFMQKTDIGSMGVNQKEKLFLEAYYPFYEGNATIGLYISKMKPFGAFWPMEEGEELEVTYLITCNKEADFQEACWNSISSVIKKENPEAVEIAADVEELVKYRLEALNRFYVEKNKAEDFNEPAGFVLNCHPQEGRQLENIIQYGFTGQNILNAYNLMRYGYQWNNDEYKRRANKIADFFADVIQIKESGMFYNLYNVDMKKVNFWWTGLLLPLAYATGEELAGLMGPLYEYRKDVIDTLSKMEGAYLRCMNEDVTALLRLYVFERNNDKEHNNWKEAILKYGAFLIKTQEDDGGWYRAYDLQGNSITKPEIWFGTQLCEKKSSTATSIPFLVELYQLTKDIKYLNAARRAGDFVNAEIIDKVRFNGGVHDSIYAKGQLIDNESILYPMFAMLSLYEETKEIKYLEGAIKAARFHASWVCLWNVPLPTESTLNQYGFKSIGMGACDTCGSGYLHPFQLMGVAELAKIAIYAKDKELMKCAELYWKGCNQTVALPDNTWGYAFLGLQEEGYLVSWWAVDDPMFAKETGFGNRWKGEGNKTCFPWINAVGVKAYWSLIDYFKTTDFDKIKNEIEEE